METVFFLNKMQIKLNHLTENAILLFVVILFLSVILFTQVINPYLYECDGYYHIKLPYLMHHFNIKSNFPWSQFSTFKNCFSDKEYIFHVLVYPFTLISGNFHLQAKISVLFFVIIFLMAFISVQNKYSDKIFIALSIIALFLSTIFLSYINYLRPKTFALTLILFLLYFLLNKRYMIASILSIVYMLSHISYPMVILLCAGVEVMRYTYNKEFCARNICYPLLAIVIAHFLHPNYPNNFLSLHLNSFIVPWNTMFGALKLNYGLEWSPADTKTILFDFLILFLGIFLSFYIYFKNKNKISLHTFIFFGITVFFIFISMFSICYWYFAYPIGLIFINMFFTDLAKNNLRIKNVIILFIGIIIIIKGLLIYKQDMISADIVQTIEHNSHYEKIAQWMNRNIPAGEIIYHTSWSDSPYFICLNPKDYYLTMLDPIYMYYYDKNLYNLYNNLSNGFCKTPVKYLKKIFKCEYGYTGKGYGLYSQLRNKNNIKILFEDDYGAIFKILGPKRKTNEKQKS